MSRFLRIEHEGQTLWWDGSQWNANPMDRKDLTNREVTRVNQLFAGQKGINPELEFRK